MKYLENGCKVCRPEEVVNYESDADDYFYDSDTTDDGIESIVESDDKNQDAEIEIEID